MANRGEYPQPRAPRGGIDRETVLVLLLGWVVALGVTLP
jgi:hypothetical protein